METQGSASPSCSTETGDLLEFINLDGAFQSPSLSPAHSTKSHFVPPASSMSTTPLSLPANQVLPGPSHEYDAYKQQTPLVPGALSTTHAINEASLHMANYNLGYISPGEELFDFNGSPSQNTLTAPEMDIEFDPTVDGSFLSQTAPISPQQGSAMSTGVAMQPYIGRLYPGVHAERAAAAKAQVAAQARGLFQTAEAHAQANVKGQQDQHRRQQQPKQSRPKISQPTDPIVEQKITQLLNSMRSNPVVSEPDDGSPLVQVPRIKKDQDEMDEDERLLASEEGKKLSSKERRQLRNKVSARAFRSRRKEYIGQLESEVAAKVTENNDLRAENQALSEENQRLTSLTRILLQSTQFSSFLDALSQNPAGLLPQGQRQVEQRQPEPAEIPKDANPYNTTPFRQTQHIGMGMVPEQAVDYSMLQASPSNAFYPHVFAVLETPELPDLGIDTLMGKTSSSIDGAPASDKEKNDVPSLEVPVATVLEKPQALDVNSAPALEKKSSNLDGDIFDDDGGSTAAPRPFELDADTFSAVDIFGGIEPEKALARYELVDSSEEEQVASIALKRVERLAASLATTLSGMERLDMDI